MNVPTVSSMLKWVAPILDDKKFHFRDIPHLRSQTQDYIMPKYAFFTFKNSVIICILTSVSKRKPATAATHHTWSRRLIQLMLTAKPRTKARHNEEGK